MDIKNINTPAVSGRNNDPAKPANGDVVSSKPAATSEIESNVDKVTLTDVQGQLRALEQKAMNVHSENADRITQLREAINNGSYKVDAEKVADKLMQTEAMFARF
jgi:negative regulator of flagellin synthesis FlgM